MAGPTERCDARLALARTTSTQQLSEMVTSRRASVPLVLGGLWSAAAAGAGPASRSTSRRSRRVAALGAGPSASADYEDRVVTARDPMVGRCSFTPR